MTTLNSVIQTGTLAALPAASIAGRLYFTTDTLHVFRDSGTAWVDCTPSGGALSNPMTTAGDIIIGGTAGAPTRLAAGANGNLLAIASGVPAYIAPNYDAAGAAAAAQAAAIAACLSNVPPVTISTLTPSTKGLIVKGSSGTGTPTLVQSASSFNTSGTPPLAATFGSANTVGNTIIAIGLSFNQFATNGVTDSAGNTYTQVFADGGNIEIYVASNIRTGANTVTCASVGSGEIANLIILEYSGLLSSGPFDAGNSANGSVSAGVALATGNITTTAAGDLVLVVGSGSTTLTSTGGRALLGSFAASPFIPGSGCLNMIWSGIQSAAGTTSDGVASSTATVVETCGIFAFKSASSATQTADLQEWQSSAGTVLSGVNGSGQMLMAKTTGIPTNTAAQGALAFDPATEILYGYGASGWASIGPLPSGSAHLVLATPTGATGVASLRALVAADVPTLNQSTTGTAASLSTALVVTLGGLATVTAPAAAQIPIAQSASAYAPTTVSGDGTLSSAGALAVTKTGGVAFAPSATTDTTNASNIASGTLPAARLPLATSAAFGGVKVDGTTITAASGVISATPTALPTGATNLVLATPNGSTGIASLRALVAADVPTLNQSTTGTAASLSTALVVTLGGLATVTAPAAAQIPIAQSAAAYAPKAVSGDGTLSIAGALVVTKTNGVAFATSATTDTTNASNIASGTLAAARLPATMNATAFGGNVAVTGTLAATSTIAGLGIYGQSSVSATAQLFAQNPSTTAFVEVFANTLTAGLWTNISQAGDSGIIFTGGTGSGSGNFVLGPYGTGGLRVTGAGNVAITGTLGVTGLSSTGAIIATQAGTNAIALQLTNGSATVVACAGTLGAAGFSALSQAGDSGIFWTNTSNGFVLAPNVGSSGGLRMDGSGNVTETGNLNVVSGAYKASGVQVLTTQQTGLGTALAAHTLSGTYATDYSFLQTLYNKVVALETICRAHGFATT